MLTFGGKVGTLGILIALIMVGCGSEPAKKEKNVEAVQQDCGSSIQKNWQVVAGDDRARTNLLWVDSACGEQVAAIRSIVGADTLEKIFVLRDSAAFTAGGALPGELSSAMVLRTPLQRVAVLSSAQIGYMLRLGVEDRIIAVGAGKYIADSTLYAKAAAGQVAEVSPDGMNVDYEKLIALKPDLVMTFVTGGSQDDYDRMEKLGIPVMLTSEWQENSLEAKAAWIKLYSSLFNVEMPDEKKDSESFSDSLVYGDPAGSADPCVEQKVVRFGQNEKRGFKVVARGPRVLAGMSYGGVWYAPGGRSYTADLIRKAGGCYLWASDTTRELKLTIEDVMALADSVDIWINPGMFGTPEEILAAEPRAAYIKAFKEKKVLQNDGRKGPGGGNDFFEGAVARPDELVENLSSLISTTAKKPVSGNPAFEWYRNIF
ncbi:MAG: ABC transporter substrate-binding protein [Fibrobacter sp.]|nr:ABC transporter substrate-binding protein [Fibrobacter sp.]